MNFGGYEVVYGYDESEIIIVPVPYDKTSTYIRGADLGPEALLQASPNLEFYDIETSSEVHTRGIHTIDPVSESDTPESLTGAVQNCALKLLREGKFPVFIGGNHTISIGAFRAFAGHYKNLSILQLDAHADLRQSYEGSDLNHACAMARARECAPLVQVGIRSMSADELPFVQSDRIFYSSDLHNNKELYSRALDKLTENVYITIDLDVFDPSLLPSTGTPEPGGPSYYDLMHFLRRVTKARNVVGFDIVELCPNPVSKVSDFVAAKVLYQLLSYVFENR
jgi:agmatinase